MNNDNRLQIVTNYFESLIKGDIQKVGTFLADDVIWHQPGNNILSKTYHSKKEVLELFGKFMTISQGSFKIDSVKSIMENGNLVCIILHFSARKNNGEYISMDGVDIMKVEDGLIREVWLFSSDQKAGDSFWR